MLGTLPAPLCIGLGAACEIAQECMEVRLSAFRTFVCDVLPRLAQAIYVLLAADLSTRPFELIQESSLGASDRKELYNGCVLLARDVL